MCNFIATLCTEQNIDIKTKSAYVVLWRRNLFQPNITCPFSLTVEFMWVWDVKCRKSDGYDSYSGSRLVGRATQQHASQILNINRRPFIQTI
jgi:hypothetical protein